MHINMKYYIVTIGAIFIALGIGILVGFNLNYDQEFSRQQASVINDLDSKFEDLRATNDKLENNLVKTTEEYDKAVEFINNNIDKLIANELKEKTVGIISTNENNDYTNEIQDTILNANGKVGFDIVLKNSIYDEKKLEEVSSKLSLDLKTTKQMISYIMEVLKGEDASDKLQYLQELGLIKVNNLNDSYLNYDSVVLAGGSDSKNGEEDFSNIDKILISALKDENKYTIGVQKSDTKFSYVDLYAKDKITSVDNIDEGVGKLSLVISLKEGSKGQKLGRLEGSDSLLPYKK